MQNFGNTEYSEDMKILGLLFRSMPTFCIMDKLRRDGKMISTKIYWISDRRNLIKSPVPPPVLACVDCGCYWTHLSE